MAAVLQPAKKSYFFGKGYRDVGNTIKGAWRRNFVSLRKLKIILPCPAYQEMEERPDYSNLF